MAALLAEMTTQDPNQFFEVANECRVVIHLNPQVLEHSHALGIRNGVYRCADFFNS